MVWKTTRRVFADDWVQICLTMKVVSELNQDEYVTEVKKCIASKKGMWSYFEGCDIFDPAWTKD